MQNSLEKWAVFFLILSLHSAGKHYSKYFHSYTKWYFCAPEMIYVVLNEDWCLIKGLMNVNWYLVGSEPVIWKMQSFTSPLLKHWTSPPLITHAHKPFLRTNFLDSGEMTPSLHYIRMKFALWLKYVKHIRSEKLSDVSAGVWDFISIFFFKRKF